MATIRTAKKKGSSFEYDCQYNLDKAGYKIIRTSERGYQLQYDLQDDDNKIVVECKRLQSTSWNEQVNYFENLVYVAPEGYQCYLMYKSNQQPCLVMYLLDNKITVRTFESVFLVPFTPHPSTRVRVKQISKRKY